jgi:hypothetical protein
LAVVSIRKDADGDGWEFVDDLIHELDTVGEAKTCVTVGFVIHDTKFSITIAGTKATDQACSAMTIPKCAITKIYDVEF